MKTRDAMMSNGRTAKFALIAMAFALCIGIFLVGKKPAVGRPGADALPGIAADDGAAIHSDPRDEKPRPPPPPNPSERAAGDAAPKPAEAAQMDWRALADALERELPSSKSGFSLVSSRTECEPLPCVTVLVLERDDDPAGMSGELAQIARQREASAAFQSAADTAFAAFGGAAALATQVRLDGSNVELGFAFLETKATAGADVPVRSLGGDPSAVYAKIRDAMGSE